MAGLRGVLLDVDGVLTLSWEPLPGAVEVVRWLRSEGLPFLLLTNTTVLNLRELVEALRGGGFEVTDRDLLTAPMAAGDYLRRRHRTCFLLGGATLHRELAGVARVEEGADAVVVAGADPTFTWDNLNRALRNLLGGAELVAMHRSLTWTTREGVVLDAGAYLLGLERAAGVRAVVVGKPSPELFEQALRRLDLPASEVAMVGDDIEADVLAAQALGMTGVLVRTGAYRPERLEAAPGRPDHVIGSVADLPALLGELR